MSGSYRNKRNLPPVTFPTLSRDIEGLFDAEDEESVRALLPKKHELFHHPRFNIIMPGTSLLATRRTGYEGDSGTKKTALDLEKRFNFVIPFTIVDATVDSRKSKGFSVQLMLDEKTTARLNEERAIALGALGMRGESDVFRGIVISSSANLFEGESVLKCVGDYLAVNVDNCSGAFLPAQEGYKTNK